jgi:uncharacterized membrane protein
MNSDLARHPRLERLLASFLHIGTGIGCLVIGIGLAVQLIDGASIAAMPIITAGIAIFILLPVLRVLIMLLVFLQERDRRFSMITALVLAIIIIGAVLGSLSSRAMRG